MPNEKYVNTVFLFLNINIYTILFSNEKKPLFDIYGLGVKPNLERLYLIA